MNKSDRDKRVVHLENLFQKDLARRWTVREMARSVNLSVSHLNRLFKAHTGLSPSQYLRRLRLSVAARLLKETFLTVKEIRFKTGIEDKSRFLREFKKKYGMTPLDYRERSAESVNRKRPAQSDEQMRRKTTK